MKKIILLASLFIFHSYKASNPPKASPSSKELPWAKIDLSNVKVLNIFKYIRNNGNISDEEMLRTFNCGVGFNLVAPQKDKAAVMKHVQQFYDCYEIGTIEMGDVKVQFENRINWI